MADLKIPEIAEYIKMLLDRVNALEHNQKILANKDFINQAQVPFAGMAHALETLRPEIVEVTFANETGRYFTGYRCEPSGQAADPWTRISSLSEVTVYCKKNISLPNVGDKVFTHFTGTYLEGETEVGVYGFFDISEPTPAKILSGGPDIYRVELYDATFEEIEGPSTLSTQVRSIGVAHNWVSSPTHLPLGTKVIVHRSNTRLWFQFHGCCSSLDN